MGKNFAIQCVERSRFAAYGDSMAPLLGIWQVRIVTSSAVERMPGVGKAAKIVLWA